MEYTSLDKCYISKRGTVFIVKNEIERNRDNNNLLGSEVLIDGYKYKVRGVESFAKATGISIGDNIGLLVWEIAKIGDTVRTCTGREFVVLSQEMEEDGRQLTSAIPDEEHTDDHSFSPSEYAVPNCNFMIIKRA